MTSYWLFYLLTFFAEILGTVGGFGSSVFFVPIASFFLGFHEVLGITALLHVFSNISKIFLFRKGLDKAIFLKIGIPSIIFVVVGAYLSSYLNTHIAELVIGIFLVVFAGFSLIKENFSLQATTTNALLGGSLAGFMAGLVGTGGAIRGLTLASFDVAKDTFLATSALIDFGVDASRFLVYFQQNYLNNNILKHAPMLFLISMIGSWLGKQILNQLSQQYFKRIALWLILITGLVSLYKYIWW
jgi:uncharacterized protein